MHARRKMIQVACLISCLIFGSAAVFGSSATGAEVETSPSMTESAESPFASLPTTYGEALVPVRFLLSVNMPGLNQEMDRDIHCLMIDPQGLLLCSGAQMGGFYSVMARLLGRDGHPIASRTRDLKVEITVGDGETEAFAARVIARDSDRDLAWVQLTDVPEERRFVSLDLTEQAVPAVGETVYLLRRLGNYFQSPAVVSDLRIAAFLERPRPLYLASRPLGHLGMPVFDEQARLVGFTVTQVPRQGEGDAGSPRGLPGQSSPTDDMVGSLILPASALVKATALARETWAADQAEQLP